MKYLILYKVFLLIVISGHSPNSILVKDQHFEIHAVQYSEFSKAKTYNYGFNIECETGELLATINLVNSLSATMIIL